MERLIIFAFFTHSVLSQPLNSQPACVLTSNSNHRVSLSSQRDKSPYKILVLQKPEVHPGDTVEIMLTAPISCPPFVGFVVQVQSVGDRDQVPVGLFNGNSDYQAKALDCGGKVNSVMTHVNLEPKYQVRLEWTPPKEGEYVPVVTWFKTEHVFWLNEKPFPGKVIKVANRSTSTTFKPSSMPPVFRKSMSAPSIEEFLGQRVSISSLDGKFTVIYNMGNVVFHFVIMCLGVFSAVAATVAYWYSIGRRTAKFVKNFQTENQIV